MDELRHLNCPFTWKMKNVVFSPESLSLDDSQSKSNWNIETDEELQSFTLMKLMYSVMLGFENGEKGDSEKAMKKIEESEEFFIKLQSAPNGISTKAVDHIIKSTKCFILKKMNRIIDVKNILKSIDTRDKEKLEIGTLHGCQSIAWSFYFAAECDKAIENASKAIQFDSDNGLWHFILGKSLRRRRKFCIFGAKPSLEEQTAFKNAFDLLPANPYAGIYCAQMYRESYIMDKAKDAYTKILEMKPDSCDMYLKLALGFIRIRNRAKAFECLKYVASKNPNDSTYLHYKGIYLEKCYKDYKGAMKYFKAAGALGNYAADLNYVYLKASRSSKRTDTLQYLFKMLDRYKIIPYKSQAIHLYIGLVYYLLKNLNDAVEHYLKAIKIDPQSTILQSFRGTLFETEINIFDILIKEIIPLWKSKAIDRSTCEMLRDAEEACKEYNARPSKTNT